MYVSEEMNDRKKKKNKPRQGTALVGRIHERKEETIITMLPHVYIQNTYAHT